MRPWRGPQDAPPSHVLIFSVLGAAHRPWLDRRRRSIVAQPEPQPEPVATGRATVISVSEPFADPPAAAAWLARADEEQLAADLAVLNRAIHSFRLVTADPHRHELGRLQLLVARIGYGAGDEVAEGRWSEARELRLPAGRERRAKVLQPQARLAAVLGQREPTLACEELALRAQADIESGRWREAALQVLVALDASLAELAVDRHGAALRERLEELGGQRDAVGEAAQAALAGEPSEDQRETVAFTLARIEAALRARAVESA